MPESSSAGKIVRFGVFTADLSAGELRKNGVRVRLQEQPFQVLAYFLERPGEVVTREDLRQKLWPADTFVDFDHSLNTAVNKLREALGDSASSPRYVETLARRGYRFLAPVERTDPNSPALEPIPPAAETNNATRADRRTSPRSRRPVASARADPRTFRPDPGDVSVFLRSGAVSLAGNRPCNRSVLARLGSVRYLCRRADHCRGRHPVALLSVVGGSL